LVLLEAMSTGIPVVSTECVPRCLRIEGGSVIVPIDDVAALAEAMRKVSQQQDFDGEAVSRKIAEMASPQVVGRKLEQLFSEIVASK
jgi:glycosyltransferase involved in cell wall biosynthesis